MKKFSDYKNKFLMDKKAAIEYLNVSLEEYYKDHDKELFLASIKDIIKAHGGVTKIAEELHINRQHIYKMLSSKGNPTIENIFGILHLLGYKFVLQPIDKLVRNKKQKQTKNITEFYKEQGYFGYELKSPQYQKHIEPYIEQSKIMNRNKDMEM